MTTYKIKIEFTREVLGTNPLDPHVLDTHIHQKQRELIMNMSKVNKEVNKYIDAVLPSKEKTDAELEAIVAKLESILGYTLDEETREMVLQGELGKLKETFVELNMKGTTVFFWNTKERRPMIGDHQVYGFLKEAAEAYARTLKKKARGVCPDSISYSHSCINQHVACRQKFITFSNDVMRYENGDANYLHRSLRAKTAQGPRVCLAKSERVPPGSTIEFDLDVMDGSPITLDVLKIWLDVGMFIGFGQWRSGGYGRFGYTIREVGGSKRPSKKGS